MTVFPSPTFLRDLKKIRDRSLLARVQTAIHTMRAARTLADVPGVVQLQGYSDIYRVRIGEYRIGFQSAGTTITLRRFLHRSVMYRHFP